VCWWAQAGRRPSASFYHWSGSNSHFQLAYHDSIAMGGGGHFGLWLDEAFEYGSSGRSDTYNNPPLGSDESFRIIRVELWELCSVDLERAASLSPRLRADTDPLSPRASCTEPDEMPPIINRAERQGSSAFLATLLSPALGSERLR
jgi:hypothetical protein